MKPGFNKFSAKRTPCQHGHVHASKREAARCGELHLMQRAGQISGLQIEPVFTFAIEGKPVMMLNGQAAKYRPDFSYIEDGKKVCEDVKSPVTITEAFRLRAALFRALWPDIELRLTR